MLGCIFLIAEYTACDQKTDTKVTTFLASLLDATQNIVNFSVSIRSAHFGW